MFYSFEERIDFRQNQVRSATIAFCQIIKLNFLCSILHLLGKVELIFHMIANARRKHFN